MAAFSNLIRLVPLHLEDLPSHPALKRSVEQKRPRRKSTASELQVPSTDPQKTTQRLDESESETVEANGRPRIGPFVKTILDSAVDFIDETLPSTFKPGSDKSSAPAKAKIQLLRRDITAKELSKVDWLGSKIPRHPPDNVPSEAWFARRSRHANQRSDGTADFSEFDYGLRVDHCKHEGEYTPDVFDTYKVLDWTIPDALTEEESSLADYQNITMSSMYNLIVHVFSFNRKVALAAYSASHSMSRLAQRPLSLTRPSRTNRADIRVRTVFEMCHKLPFPLSTRVFSVLVVTAKTGTQGFIIVQLPVHIDIMQEAFYSNGRNLKEGTSALKRRKPIMGFGSRPLPAPYACSR